MKKTPFMTRSNNATHITIKSRSKGNSSICTTKGCYNTPNKGQNKCQPCKSNIQQNNYSWSNLIPALR